MAQIARKISPDRREIACELVKLRAENSQVFAREAELEAELKQAAVDADENFQEVFPGLGIVKVSGPKEARCKGSAPELQVDAFYALTEKQRENLTGRGVVKIIEQWTKKFYGRVVVELFPQTQ